MRTKNNHSLKIAMLGHKTVPARDSSRGGIEVVVEELAARLVALGNEVTCYNRTGCDNGGLKEYKGIKLKSVFTIKRRGLAAMTSSFFATIRASFSSYDVIHFHAEGPCFWMWIPALLGKRCVATIHGIDHQREKWSGGPGTRFIKSGEKMAVKHASEIIVLSHGVQDYFQETYHRKTVFIPNGVSRPERKEAKEITEKFGLKKDSYILFLGRIVPEKGLRCLLDACKGLRTDKRLVIAGGASDTDDFMSELRRKASNDDRILFTGFVNGRLREELYSNAYIYTLPSDLEGMPLSLLEAMSYGNCCVVSDIAECAEVVEDKAVVFHKGDAAELREKLQELCDDIALMENYKKNAADFICGKYSWDEVAEKTLRLYGGEKCAPEIDSSGSVLERRHHEDFTYQ
ncbi:MAG: glycosyltransferase family 4 protein [Lachnospiraceae bacterium]|nr:glycosyltransferase family 4 protein [Lachnospiraceae bacterium]